MSLLDALTKTLVQQYADKLNQQEQIELIEALEIVARDQKYNRFSNFFPDTGDYRRDLYPKHIEFFNAGEDYLERAFIAGNRVGKCLSYNTFIELDDGTKEMAGVLYERRKRFRVKSWDGEKVTSCEVTDFIKKPAEIVYRVWLENGEWFECAANHRVLSQDGSWNFVDTLLESSPRIPCSSWDNGHSIPFVGVLRYLQKLRDCQDRYHPHCRFDDEQLRLGEESDQVWLQRLNDALRHIVVSLREGGLGSKYTSNHQPSCDHQPNLDEGSPASAQFFSVGNQAISLDVLRRILNSQNNLQSAYLSFVARSLTEALQDQYQFSSLFSPLGLDGNRIIAYSIIGVKDIYDFTVEVHHNYISHGVIHHNTEAGAYEVTCHATGRYPAWWKGRRFNRPVLIWVGGDTATTVRDIIQKKLVGDDLMDMGSGMLPKDAIVTEKCKTRRNVPEALEIIKVRSDFGGESTIVLKTYEQGRATWQGTEVDVIWVDEECPMDVYGEGLIRLMTTNGIMLLTFTPLQGVTDLVLSFLDNSQDTDSTDKKYVQVVSWDDVPHLTEDIKKKMLASTPPQLREARSKGTPTVGEGLVYPIDPKNVVIDDFQIPRHYKKLYGMDVGWNNTAAVWGAWDVENDIIYVYSEHLQGLVEPIVHAKAIKSRGEWIRGEIDPAARGRSQVDGQKLFEIYANSEARGGCGLKLVPANNAREAGIFAVWERFTSGRLKIFKSCTGLLREMSLYHRDQHGQIVKTNDHRLDSLRYLINAPASHWQFPQQPGVKKVIQMNDFMNACT